MTLALTCFLGCSCTLKKVKHWHINSWRRLHQHTKLPLKAVETLMQQHRAPIGYGTKQMHRRGTVMLCASLNWYFLSFWC